MDGLQHHEWAVRIAQGDRPTDGAYFRAPLYYYLLGGVYRLVGVSPMAGRVLGIVFGAVVCYLIARLGILLAGPRAGVLAGLLAAVYWPLIHFDGELLTVGLENLLNVAFLLVLLAARKRRSSVLTFLAGALFGLSAITRPNVLVFAPVLMIWFFLAEQAAPRLLRTLKLTALVGVGAALVILPVTIRNLVVADDLVLIAANGGVNFFIGNNPESDGASALLPGARKSVEAGYIDTHRIAEAAEGRPLKESEVSRFWYHQAWKWIAAEPGKAARLMLWKFMLFWSAAEISNNMPIGPSAGLSSDSALFWIDFPVVACLGIAGLTLLSDWRRWFLPVAFGVVYMLTVVLFFCNERYRMPVAPILILLTAAGLDRLIEVIRSRQGFLLFSYLMIGGGVGLFMLMCPPKRSEHRLLEQGQWHFMLGNYYRGRGVTDAVNYGRAAKEYVQAMELMPTNPDPEFQLASLLVTVGRLDEAEKRFVDVITKHPEHVEARFAYAQLLASTGRDAEAVTQLSKCVEQREMFAEAHEALGCLLLTQGKKAAAERHLRRALEIAPDFAKARSCLQLVGQLPAPNNKSP